jgi:hypothetical protein
MSNSLDTLVKNNYTKLINGIALDQHCIYSVNAKGYIAKFNLSGKMLTSIGGEGYSKYLFRQLVAITVTDGYVFVCDWHNHRVVVFNLNLIYLEEFGFYQSRYEKSKIKIVLKRYLKILKSHEYIYNHIGDFIKKKVVKSTFVDSARRLLYFSFFRKISKFPNLPIDKPNGVVITDNFLYLTQKNNKCVSKISLFDKSTPIKTISGFDHDMFGRLGNICKGKQALYICDEPNSKIYITDFDCNLVTVLQGFSPVDPFCCVEVTSSVLCVGGVKGCVLYSMDDSRVIQTIEVKEVHGLDYNPETKILYIASRILGEIVKQKVEIS